MARPPIEIDSDQVMKLSALGAKTEEIASFFECSTDTIQRRFAAEITKGRAQLKMKLRQWQLKAAEKGNSALLIWLGKQLLGQADVQELEIRPNSPLDGMNPQQQLEAMKLAVAHKEAQIAAHNSRDAGDGK